MDCVFYYVLITFNDLLIHGARLTLCLIWLNLHCEDVYSVYVELQHTHPAVCSCFAAIENVQFDICSAAACTLIYSCSCVIPPGGRSFTVQRRRSLTPSLMLHQYSRPAFVLTSASHPRRVVNAPKHSWLKKNNGNRAAKRYWNTHIMRFFVW